MHEVLRVTNQVVGNIRQQFATKIAEITSLPEDVQAKVYERFYGPIQFDMEVEKQFAAIKPWVCCHILHLKYKVERWIEVQVPSILQREIFAKSRTALEVHSHFALFTRCIAVHPRGE